MATILAPIVEETIEVSCAVEVFVATALLHREHPEREDFTIQEIVNRVARENLTGALRSGINVHVSQHCVANKPPNPAKHRMLYATGKHKRRLALPNDIAHEDRTGKIFPDAEDVPEAYRPVLIWAQKRFERVLDSPDFWAEDAVERVRQLRSDELLSVGYTPIHSESESIPNPLQALLDAKGIGVEMAMGTDLDEHLRKVREGWE
jgi:hypothetical protein